MEPQGTRSGGDDTPRAISEGWDRKCQAISVGIFSRRGGYATRERPMGASKCSSRVPLSDDASECCTCLQPSSELRNSLSDFEGQGRGGRRNGEPPVSGDTAGEIDRMKPLEVRWRRVILISPSLV